MNKDSKMFLSLIFKNYEEGNESEFYYHEKI